MRTYHEYSSCKNRLAWHATARQSHRRDQENERLHPRVEAIPWGGIPALSVHLILLRPGLNLTGLNWVESWYDSDRIRSGLHSFCINLQTVLTLE